MELKHNNTRVIEVLYVDFYQNFTGFRAYT